MNHLDAQADRIAGLIAGTGNELPLFVTGAGVSVASGIPTFRGADPDAIWRRDDIEIATFRALKTDPQRFWDWYARRFLSLRGKLPNEAHRALAAIDLELLRRGREFLLITQNIDTLHEQAGARRLVKVHGTSDRVRCARHGCEHGAPTGSLPLPDGDLDRYAAEIAQARLPVCPACGGVMRPHVLLFDEFYTEHADYGFDRVEAAAARAAFIAFIGTSLSVGVTAFLESAARRRGVPALLIDPAPAPAGSGTSLSHVAARAEELLPRVLARIAG
jgi:NAD-dependent deacetylase